MHAFLSPVHVRSDLPGSRQRIEHVEGAADELLKWAKRGPRWHKAMTLCSSALEGDPIDPQIIRKAFAAAAKEAQMLLPSD
ncbi:MULTISPECIES: DUF982 domain-containing protein [unclassified Mesorhizobium]|uniref:DUF982 domain-containing protein n=1 Tax=unclassified Mesorhizobium TaxID=325217 RepID=UPI000FCCD215|nr:MULTISPECIES: DUF982 domain-containing protein [unclassified Mesorhizobium]RUX98102.1 DUF982 domain-containing protein [Mesorhizobium sp. M7D.F.Ca.US.004.01.2.1]RVA37243.1 DUF982 domain-containing protein [Mesorhizobium sp. M7D.F.Ca.US.004.03.1.1]